MQHAQCDSLKPLTLQVRRTTVVGHAALCLTIQTHFRHPVHGNMNALNWGGGENTSNIACPSVTK